MSFSFSQSQEQNFQEKFKFYHISEWENGMEFYVEKQKYSSSLKKIKEYHPKGKGKIKSLADFEGKIFTFKRHEERIVKCPKGKCKRVYSIFENDNQEYEFNEFIGSLEELKTAQIFDYINEMVFYEDYKKALDLFLNKEFYLVKNICYDYLSKVNKPITINKIEVNDTENPVKIFFTINETGKEKSVELRLSGTNSRYPCSTTGYSICNFDEYFVTEEVYLKRQKDIQIKKEEELLALEKEEKEQLAKEEKEKQERLAKEEKETKEKWIQIKSDCKYSKNEVDEFSGIKKIYTEMYNLNHPSYSIGEINIELQKNGSSKYIWFHTNNDLGCSSSYDNNKSYVKVKLENGVIVTFYHIGKTDCSDFSLFAKLTSTDILKLKKSPIKSIRLSGTDYYHDVKSVEWKTFFIDKIDCIK
jgi:hypothetical protein